MLKIVPQPEIKTKSDIKAFFKARNITFKNSDLKKELYKQLGLSELLEPIKSVSDMAHKKRGINFQLILKNKDWCLKYQYVDTEIKFIDNRFKVVNKDELKEGFYSFNGDEACSFIQYCVEDDLEFKILATVPIDKAKLIATIK